MPGFADTVSNTGLKDWVIASEWFPEAAPMWDVMWKDLGQDPPEVTLQFVNNTNDVQWMWLRAQPDRRVWGQTTWYFHNKVGWRETPTSTLGYDVKEHYMISAATR